jgi:DNA-directed RNA polymerase beta' subunit
MSDTKYIPTIGLEVHAELKTKTKMFCDSPNDPDEEKPNVNTCPICLGHPGTLPTLNKEAIRKVLMVGHSINAEIADFTEWDRKNYFYPDIPKGYQISQYKYPLISGGEVGGVEITRNVVRRERGAHIDLATPVAHIWFLRGFPSRIATLLGISAVQIEKVVYFASYIVTSVDEKARAQVLTDIDAEFKTKSKAASNDTEKKRLKDRFSEVKSEVNSLAQGTVIDEETYHTYTIRYGTIFEASIGAEAIYNLFKEIDLEKFAETLIEARDKAGAAERLKLNKRIALVQQLSRSKQRPEHMFLSVLPVSPPALRPMVALEGGRHASSDVNDLYRRVINRNNRLKKLIDIQAPEVILRNEKRNLSLKNNNMKNKYEIKKIQQHFLPWFQHRYHYS